MAANNIPTEVRPGEELPVSALLDWMKRTIPGVKGPLRILQYPGGFSNLTYLVTDDANHAWVLRRPPFGIKPGTAHDMVREFHILSALKAQSIAPNPIAYSDDAQIMGAPFYLMENIDGVILRNRIPDSVQATPDRFSKLSNNFIQTLVRIHQADWQSNAVLRSMARPEGYVSRQIEGWCKRYELAETKTVTGADELMDWLQEEQPSESDATLVHNDYKYDNLVLNPGNWAEIRAVLDWEMATIGDPLMDLGTSLAYWTEAEDPSPLKMFGVTHHNGNLTRQQLLERYEEYASVTVNQPVFYYAFGLFKIAVIAEQIFARYKKGLTQDPRFASLHIITETAVEMAISAIERNSIAP